ncbi:MAG: RNA-binding transcriptional accessory protein [Chloroflexi bacterium]|nr:RNA-binding transcriptional accessory protein [Chloroflexota bacterium]
MDYAYLIAKSLTVRAEQVTAAIQLFDAGNTLPFVARYRKEQTGGLDEEQLRSIQSQIARLRELDERREAILSALREQGNLSDELAQALAAATDKTTLEDLYAPFKPKRRTRASIARERGLEGLADIIQMQPNDPIDATARQFLNEQVTSIEEALAGARDIVAEQISDHPEVRRQTRERALRWGVVRSELIADAEDSKGVYQTYYQFESTASRLKPYQVLALNRGETEHILRFKIQMDQRDWFDVVAKYFPLDQRSAWAEQLRLAIHDGAERLLLPAIERDVRRALTEQAESHAITVFAKNVHSLLLQAPIANNVVLGLDPGYRTGCKVAIIGQTGNVLTTATIYPHSGAAARERAFQELQTLIKRYTVSLIAIGNGTASRETEQLVADVIRHQTGLHYLIVSEAGASVYSASSLARSELPDLDVSLRGAVSIARRVQDPLAELVKIEPKAIGVGMYQHDVDQSALGNALDGVVESAVNNVGVDVNTASPALLRYVAGIGPKLSAQIVSHREENGPFRSRQALKKVKGLGPKAFEQAAGFLRIRDGDEALDASAIHPESYTVTRNLLAKLNINAKTGRNERIKRLEDLKNQPLHSLAAELGTGVPTLSDIIDQLLRPGRDPREDVPAPILRSDVLAFEDLQPGMQLKGTVRNVVDWGAFIDLGVKHDGLLHRSQIPRGLSLSVGDIVDVSIQSIDPDRKRIALVLAQ